MFEPRLLLLLFAASGFTGLIYESIWTHYLKLFLGHAAYAQALVLSIFMGGLAGGSWLAARWVPKLRQPLRAYALTEAAIGVLALVFHPVFDGFVRHAHAVILPSLPGPMAITLFKWGAALLLILPQSLLLGMTFPLISAAFLRNDPDHPGKSLALLYFANSIGAAVGVLVTGFAMIRYLGLPGTIGTAGAANLLLAGVVLAMSSKAGSASATPPAVETQTAGHYRLFLLIAAGTGLASFIYEISWIRMLSLVLSSSSHSFELMLSAFILGLACGGLWIKRHLDSQANPVRMLVNVQIAMGTLALATLPLYNQTFNIMAWLVKTLPHNDSGYLLFNTAEHAIACLIMIPATFCAGMTMPLLTAIVVRLGGSERCVGIVYAANTVGAIAGVFLSVHLGLPLMGLKGTLIAGALTDAGLGLLLAWRMRSAYPGNQLPWRTIGCGAAAIALLAMVKLDAYKLSSGVYRFGALNTAANSKLLFHRDGKTATVSITDHGEFISIRTNGKVDASLSPDPAAPPTMDEPTMVLLAALPLSMHPAPRNAAVIGLGSGMTTHTLLGSSLLTAVDTIEIESEMAAAARLFGSRVTRAFEDPRSHIHFDDAKTFFASHRKGYDIIISEPSNPWVSGIAGLFTTEFYRQMLTHLNRDGIFVQWIHLYETEPRLVATILKALSSQFSDYALYAGSPGDMLIVAKKAGRLPPPGHGIFNEPLLRSALSRLDIRNTADLQIRKIGNGRSFDPLMKSFDLPANSDYHPVLDQHAGKARFLKSDADSLINIVNKDLPIIEMLEQRGLGAYERVTPSRFLPRSEAFQHADAMAALLLGGTAPAGANLPAEVQGDLLRLRHLSTDCRSLPEPERLALLFNFAKRVAPFVPPQRFTPIAAALLPPACAPSVTQQHYVALFQAINQQNGAEMYRFAESLLSEDQHLTPTRAAYLLATAMLGHLALGERQAAAQIWQRYQPQLYGKQHIPMTFRFLTSQISAP